MKRKRRRGIHFDREIASQDKDTVARIPRPWVAQHLQRALEGGLLRAYARVKVDPEAYLRHVRRAHALPIRSWDDMFLVRQEFVDDLARQTISAATKLAALEGAGLGLGGLLAVLPDASILSAIVVRLLQKLSLIHGFTYATEEETAALWLAAGSAAGLDLGRELVEKEAIERFVPRLIERITTKMSAEVCEKWSARMIPLVSGALGGTLNYYFVREWGRRARLHFQEKHHAMRGQMSSAATPALQFPAQD